jgi:hypothetical protein
MSDMYSFMITCSMHLSRRALPNPSCSLFAPPSAHARQEHCAHKRSRSDEAKGWFRMINACLLVF